MTSAETDRARALIALILGACAIAFAPIFVRLTGAGPAATGFWRLLLALPALTFMTALARSGERGGRFRPTAGALLAGVFFALDLGFWHYGIKFTTVADATILANLSPVFVTVGAWLLLSERPGRLFVAGLALALGGAWAIAAGHGAAAGPARGLGDGLSIATAVWYAAYMLVVRRARAGQSASALMLWSSAMGALLLLSAALALKEPILPASPGGWAACVGLATVHVAGQGAITWALGRLEAAVASVIILAQPVLAAVLGWIIFSEPMGPLQIAGGVIALAGVGLAQASTRKRP